MKFLISLSRRFLLDRAEQPPECVGYDPSGRMRHLVSCAPRQCWDL